MSVNEKLTASVNKFFVNHFWAKFQRLGAKDPTRAATNPGLCNKVDGRIHEWAANNDKGIATVVAGHTHRAVFENMSITERRYQESKVKTEIIKIKNEPDTSYFNRGSCFHPLSITESEIPFEDTPRVVLVEWRHAYEEDKLFIKRTSLLNSASSPAA